MATNEIVKKTAATSVNDDFYMLVTQKENVSGTEKDALRRMSQSVYAWSELPNDIKLSVQLMFNSMRQSQWDNGDRLSTLEEWMSKHGTVEIGTKTLQNTVAFPFNNSQQTVALAKAQKNNSYIVMTEVTAHSGNVGEIEVAGKLTNGFKLSFSGSAKSVTIKYTVIGGFNV